MQLEQTRNKSQRRLSNDDILGKTLYPSGSAKTRRAVVEVDSDTADSFYPCKQCGTELDMQVVQSPGGTPDGNGNVRQVSGSPVVDSGFCWFCGSANNR